MGDSYACSLLCPLIQVAQLRQCFFHSIAPGGLVGDRRGVVHSSGFYFSAQQILKVIKENRDLDLPAHKVMVTTVRGEEIASDKLRCLTSDESQMSNSELSQLEFLKANGVYDREAFYFDELVRKAKRQQLESKHCRKLT
ncbi:hypothetical protein RHMOL_Rhmol05G0177200 [Rhododendron molle]|uniref:Uncharacterized protein n=1 Tax=Rhododendron molle TaxID=49168 RepID=A0ACC0NRA5_RHOML|nr:hypothetical protein RHMOL_Rhmol05G0177200 [Rhododendron molle]